MTQQDSIAVIGAGIAGLSVARSLVSSGYDNITLYDYRGFPPASTSALAGGMLAPYGEVEHIKGVWLDAALAALGSWEAGDEEMRASCGFHKTGSLIIAHPEDRPVLERFRAHLPDDLQPFKDTGDYEPALGARFAHALMLPEDAYLNPADTLRFMTESLRNKVIFEEKQVVPADLESDIVIDCRGYEAGYENLRGVKGELAMVRNEDFQLSRPVRLMHPRYPLYIIPRAEHTFLIGATEIETSESNAGEVRVSLRSGMELLSALYSLHPSFGEADILALKSGIRPAYSDNLPKITMEDRLISCNGLFRHGYLFAPLVAEIVSALLQEQKHPFMDLLMRKDHYESQDQRAA